MIREINDKSDKERIARSILADLPDWFGLPDSTENYITESQDLPFLAGFEGDEAVGFAVLKPSSPDCADIFVMGIKKRCHSQGMGKALYLALEQLAREQGYTYMQVKTVQSGHHDSYDITNRFYQAMGFKELECFPDMWDSWNPCQIYIKYIG